MPAFGWIAAAIGVASAIFGHQASRKAASARRHEAELNAERIRMEAEEEARRKRLEHQQNLAESRARAGASGVLVGSKSTQGFLAEMKSVFDAEQAWLAKSGAFRSASELSLGEKESKAIKTRGTAELIGNIGRIWGAHS